MIRRGIPRRDMLKIGLAGAGIAALGVPPAWGRSPVKGTQVTAVLYAAHLVADAVRRRRAHAERSVAARFRDGGDDLGERHFAHAGQEHRVLDLEEITDRCAKCHLAYSGVKPGSEISRFTSLPLS